MPVIDYSRFDNIVDSDDEECAKPPVRQQIKPAAKFAAKPAAKPAAQPAAKSAECSVIAHAPQLAEGATPAKSAPPAQTRDADPPVAVESGPRLVGVLSSHVGNHHRLARLGQLFYSVGAQTQKLSAFFVVWSAPEALVPSVELELDRLAVALQPSPLRSLRQTRRTSQCYDLRWLHDELLDREPPGTWLLFTDDDDLWGPQRVRAYLGHIHRHAGQPGVTAVCATHKVRPASRSKIAQSPQEVDAHLKSGDAKHCGGVRVEEEFFDFACPRESLGQFLAMCNEETLLHPFCDLRLTRFLSEYVHGGKVMYFATDKPGTPWVYYYSTAHRTPEDDAAYSFDSAQDQASAVVKPRDEDRTEAAELCKQLHGSKPSQEQLEEMLEFVSTLRQNTEAMLIRHFPDEPMKTAEMRRIAVGQAQGELHAMRVAERLARQACGRFGIQLV